MLHIIYYLLYIILNLTPYIIYQEVYLSLSLSLYIYIYIYIWGRAKPHPIWNMACATTSIYLAKNGSLLTSFSAWYGALLKQAGGSKKLISCPTPETFNHATSLPNKAYDRQHMQKEIYNINPSWFCSGVCLCVCLYLSHLGWSYVILCHAVSFAFHWNASETNLM